jgi:hypothetical protein
MESLIVLNGCRTIQLSQGYRTLIDAGDCDRINSFKWWAQTCKRCPHLVYARRHENAGNNKRRLVSLHRLLADAPPKTYVDHRNGDGLDNRRSNLRVCTHSENHRNRHRSKGRSKFKGVHHRRDNGMWRAYICAEGKAVWLGQFPTEAEAARAYDAAAREHYGEFAKTNADLFGDY